MKGNRRDSPCLRQRLFPPPLRQTIHQLLLRAIHWDLLHSSNLLILRRTVIRQCLCLYRLHYQSRKISDHQWRIGQLYYSHWRNLRRMVAMHRHPLPFARPGGVVLDSVRISMIPNQDQKTRRSVACTAKEDVLSISSSIPKARERAGDHANWPTRM